MGGLSNNGEYEDWQYGHSRISTRGVPQDLAARWTSPGDSISGGQQMRLHLLAPEDLRWRILWSFLDDPNLETRNLINLEEFTEYGSPV